jgi:uncharacterized membrane protein
LSLHQLLLIECLIHLVHHKHLIDFHVRTRLAHYASMNLGCIAYHLSMWGALLLLSIKHLLGEVRAVVLVDDLTRLFLAHLTIGDVLVVIHFHVKCAL